VKFILSLTLAIVYFSAWSTSVRAEGESLPSCQSLDAVKKSTEDRKGTWVELTNDQWQYARGVYALDPQTPPGIPVGDKAVIATIPGGDGAVIFFLDGPLVCTPMSIPAILVDMIKRVGSGEIIHAGQSE
jgi:hypothetical protein